MHDAVIVGGSVAGLYTGWKLAQAGWRVCVVERRPAIGVPVRCGEATGNRTEIERFIPLDSSWVAAEIAGLAVHMGDGCLMSRRIPQTGLMLRRGLFEQDLARRAAAAGVEIRLGVTATGLAGECGRWQGVQIAPGELLACRVMVGADGAESRLGRWAGICSRLTLAESFSAAQYRVRSGFCTDGLLHFWVGRDTIGPGYVWVFPKGDGEVSIGAGLYGGSAGGRTARGLLDEFLARRAPGAERRMLISGCVPVTVCPRTLHRGNAVVVGDAARQDNPLTAGGIMNTLEAADLLVRSLTSPGLSPARALARYSSVWRHKARFEQKVFLLLQRVFQDCSDRDLRLLLGRADRAFAHLADRSHTFRWPVLDLVRLFAMVAPKAARHLGVLWG